MSREVMQMALELIEPIAHNSTDDPRGKAYEAITALRQALETEQEPVAWANSFDLQNFDMKVRTCPDLHHTVPLYTAPPKREWVGLPESAFAAMTLAQASAMKYAELLLKEKNT